MSVLSPAELQDMLIDAAFRSNAFVVTRGEKTQTMIEEQEEKAAASAKLQANKGLPPLGVRYIPPPTVPPIAVLEKLASVLKDFVEGDPGVDAATKVKFRDFFTVISPLTNAAAYTALECDTTWDAASACQVPLKQLRKLGMDPGGDARGIDKLDQAIRSVVLGACMPNGELSDDFVCLVTLLKLDPRLTGGKIEWNEMDCAITIGRKESEDNRTSGNVRMAIGETYSCPAPGRRGMRRFVPGDQNVRQALEMIARENKYHESREYLQSLRGKWLGAKLLGTLLDLIGGRQEVKGTKAEKQKITEANTLAEKQLIKTMIGSVARTMKPGCQMDTMLVLKSAQGTKKSSLFRALAPAGRFSDVHLDFGNKDSLMALQQNSWYECAELSGLIKKELQIIKGFITSRSNDFRLPFGHAMTRNPRHCILVGTTNDDDFLRDVTGSRRFWVILVDDNKQVDINAILAVKDQLWAEAVHMYDAAETCPDCVAHVDGEDRCPEHRWWLTPAEEEVREEVNAAYTVVEPLDQAVAEFLSNAWNERKNGYPEGVHATTKNTDSLTAYKMLEALDFPPEKCHDPILQRRITGSLKRNGYIKKHTDIGNIWISPGMINKTIRLMPPVSDVTDRTDSKEPSSPEAAPLDSKKDNK